MDLTLIRHAIAEVGSDDDARPLSDRGRRRFSRSARTLAALGFRFERLLHSPKLRALQTAQLVKPACGGELEVTELLTRAPGAALLKLLAGDRVAAVGHEPHLSSLVAWLVTGSAAQGRQFELKKGAVVRLEGPPRPGEMRLRALLPPKVLR